MLQKNITDYVNPIALAVSYQLSNNSASGKVKKESSMKEKYKNNNFHIKLYFQNFRQSCLKNISKRLKLPLLDFAEKISNA